jgi:hypothetical protein
MQAVFSDSFLERRKSHPFEKGKSQIDGGAGDARGVKTKGGKFASANLARDANQVKADLSSSRHVRKLLHTTQQIK